MLRKKKRQARIYIRVLQNGRPIAETVGLSTKAQTFSLSAAPSGPLSLPLYPLAEDIPLLRIHKGHIQLYCHIPWQGFLTSKGKLIYLSNPDRSKRRFDIEIGDYASLLWEDLRVMVKAVPALQEKQLRLDPKYRGSLFSLFWGQKYEALGLLAGALTAVLFFAPWLLFLSGTKHHRPQRFEELAATYTLPFIYPKNLATAPEALQSKLDRRDMVSSVVRYYRNLSLLFMGWPLEDPSYIFSTSQELYHRLYSDHQQSIAEAVTRQKQVDARQGQGLESRVLSIPSIYGESFQLRIRRLLKKIDELQTGFDLSLSYRRKIAADFRHDPDYDWTQYRTAAAGKEAPKAPASAEETAELAKVNVFQHKSAEEIMYDEAEHLGQQALLRRRYLDLRSRPLSSLSEKASAEIVIPAGVDFASFINYAELPKLSELALSELEAMEYESPLSQKVQEPLIGSVDPRLVDRAIKSHRFQLNLCYELALRRNQNLSGRMHWVWKIDSQGRILEPTLVKSTLQDRQMINCIRRKMASWAFPSPTRGSVQVNHIFEFQPQGG